MEPEPEAESRQKFWYIVKNQLEYGENQRVKDIEELHGPFQFDDRVTNDKVKKIVVGPQILENGATYYGHW